MKTKHPGKYNASNGNSRLTNIIPNANFINRKTASTHNCVHFFHSVIATALFAMIMIVNVQHSCGLIEIQTEKEKHGK